MEFYFILSVGTLYMASEEKLNASRTSNVYKVRPQAIIPYFMLFYRF